MDFIPALQISPRYVVNMLQRPTKWMTSEKIDKLKIGFYILEPNVMEITIYEQSGNRWEKISSFAAQSDAITGKIMLYKGHSRWGIHDGKSLLGVNGSTDYNKLKKRLTTLKH